MFVGDGVVVLKGGGVEGLAPHAAYNLVR